MIILFLKFYSVRQRKEAANKEKEAAAIASTRAQEDVAVQTEASLSGAIVNESLG